MKVQNTHTLGFFLGPGFPLGLGNPSGPRGAALFVPGFGPGTPFLLDASAGVSRLLAPGVPLGAGVELLSEMLSTGEADATGTFGVEADEAVDFDFDVPLRDGGFDDGNWANLSGEMFRIMILLCFDALVPFRVFALPDDATDDVGSEPDPGIVVFGGDDGRAEGALMALSVAVRDSLLAQFRGESGSPD
jgi:hypothetical protein